MEGLSNPLRTKVGRAGFLICVVTAFPNFAHAGGFEGDTQGCPADRPCFNGIYEKGDTVIFNFSGIVGWDFYNVLYTQASGERKQVENRSGTFTVTDTKRGRVYSLSVQGCNSHTLARSTCSPWVDASFTTASGVPPALPPPPPQDVVKSIGRVDASKAGAWRPICEAAQDARSRNSPAAPSLERQCRAAGGPDAYQRLQLKQGGKYLDAVNCSDQVALNSGSTFAGGACQLWRFVPAGGGWYRLQVKQSGKYLDEVNCSGQVALNSGSTFADGACQLWRFVPAADGWSRLQVKHGEKYLDAAFCSDKLGLTASSAFAGGACQLWRLASGPR